MGQGKHMGIWDKFQFPQAIVLSLGKIIEFQLLIYCEIQEDVSAHVKVHVCPCVHDLMR